MLFFITVTSAWLSSSLVEYCIHRFLLHYSYNHNHIKDHHRVFHGIKSYEHKDVNASDIISSNGEISLKVILTLPLSLFIFFQSISFALLFILISILYTFWSEYAHLHYHKSSDIFLMRFMFFRNLKEHHRIHHCIYTSNYGIGTTLWDIILGTKQK